MSSRSTLRLATVLFVGALLLTLVPAGVVHAVEPVIYIYVYRTDVKEMFEMAGDPGTTFLEIKQAAEANWGIPVACQTLEILEGEIPDDNATLGYYEVIEGLSVYLTPNCFALPEPEELYTLWFLKHADGSACLLFSASHPSVAAQNAFCFPLKYNKAWVAAHSCGGPVFDNGYWKCQGDFDAWLEQLLLNGGYQAY